jgi:hypothetical protein
MTTRLMAVSGEHFMTSAELTKFAANKAAMAEKDYAIASDLLQTLCDHVELSDRRRLKFLAHLMSGLAKYKQGNTRVAAFMCGEAAELAGAASGQSDRGWDLGWTLSAAVGLALQAYLENVAGELEQAVKTATKAVGFFRRGYKLETGHRDFSWGLASSSAQLSDLLLSSGDYVGANDAAMADVRLRMRNNEAERG